MYAGLELVRIRNPFLFNGRLKSPLLSHWPSSNIGTLQTQRYRAAGLLRISGKWRQFFDCLEVGLSGNSHPDFDFIEWQLWGM
jgi:hypothetical protein